MSSTEPTPQAHAEWMAVLDRIEASLVQSLAHVDRPAATQDAPALTPPSPLPVLDDRLARMMACLEHVQRHTAETDTLLMAEADALRDLLASLGSARQRVLESAERGRA
jgi:hypothetical protein